MRISENWLRTFVDSPLASRELADALTMSGLEVEQIDPVAPPFDKVVVAEVREVRKHPGADRLTVCRVSTGGALLEVVCGAPNARAGIRVPLAQPGARLPAATIAQAMVRGVESNGMLCSASELGLSADASGLLILPDDAPLGADLRGYLDLNDQLFTIRPTPNRGDCLSVLGVAREVAAVAGGALTYADAAVVPAALSDRIEIVLEDEVGCSRYCGRIVRGVNARAPTPRWMSQRLERSGVRSISAIVDITNYVMLEMGQPMHAFDLSRIEGGIRVRRGRSGERIKLLNEQEVALGADLLVIADHGKPIALAGIMGGFDSAVTPDTGDILLESAFFDPAVIAGRSRQLGFDSESSYRFERGVDFAATVHALERATRLVVEICGGRPGPVCEATADVPPRLPVRLRRERAQRLLGIELSGQQIADILRRLGFAYDTRDDGYWVTPPSYRFDLAMETDLIEEVARIHGYDRIPVSPPTAPAAMLPASEARVSAAALRARMVARDYQEIISFSFVDRQWETDFYGNSDPVALANPIAANLNVMRSGLIASLVDCLRLNLSRQQERVRLFEVGCGFARAGSGYEQMNWLGGLAYGDAVREQWGAVARKVDFYDVKSDVEALLFPRIARFEAAGHPALHPGRSAKVSLEGAPVGWLGELHPKLIQGYNLPFAPIICELNLDVLSGLDPIRYREFSRQPLVRRDLSVEVAESVGAQTLLDALKKAAPVIVSEVTLFDVYRGKGIDSDKKSVAFRVVLHDTNKTLTDAEVEAAMGQLLRVLQEQFVATLRK